jgi:hypothetical protein
VDATVRITHYRETVRALKNIDKESAAVVRAALREAAWPVQSDARSRLAKYEGIGPIGISVSTSGVSVQQKAKKVTGFRPDFGALQMTQGFIPALDANVEETYRGVEIALDLLIVKEGF